MHIDWASPSNDVVNSGRVLLVDDERTLRRVLARCLARAGFEVVEVDNGLAASELLSRERFDLVVSDVQMPGMDGIALLETLLVAESAVPVVLISGSLEIQGKEEAIRLGAFDFLRKPFDLSELRQIALRAVNNRREDMLGNPRASQQAAVG
jgi:DNA-binding NtrC family response regulator